MMKMAIDEFTYRHRFHLLVNLASAFLFSNFISGEIACKALSIVSIIDAVSVAPQVKQSIDSQPLSE